MTYKLTPITEAGGRFVAAADSVIEPLRERADAADRAGAMNRDNFVDLLAAGVTTAFLPERLGGFGLTSIHDWMAGMTRLGRGDASVAITMNMHLAVSRGLALGYQGARASGNEAVAGALERQLRQIASGEMVICATATEPGTDNLHPFTEATRTGDGWEINGLKIFVTGSPIATHLAMNLRLPGEAEDGGDLIGSVMLPLDTPGIEPQDDWDAMGMRASGSQAVKFKGVKVPAPVVRPMGPWGIWSTAVLMNRNVANMPLLGVFLGIAEHAHELALSAASKQAKKDKPRNADRPGIQHTIGEMEIALAAAQAMLAQTGRYADEFMAAHQGDALTLEAGHQLLKNHQSMKWVVNRNAISIVDQAMSVVGGGAFMGKHPLSRLYRDVRAGPFMQPYSPTEAREYIGKIALGIYPED
ncbi:MAG: acyl-CoA dehydrogenase family protein [Alphaproteobacteria bacterium]